MTPKELRNALKSVKKHSAPGLDQVDFSMIANLPAEFLTRLLDVYNEILDKGFFPDFWKNSLVVLIPKADSNAVRPNVILQTKLVYRVSAYPSSSTVRL